MTATDDTFVNRQCFFIEKNPPINVTKICAAALKVNIGKYNGAGVNGC